MSDPSICGRLSKLAESKAEPSAQAVFALIQACGSDYWACDPEDVQSSLEAMTSNQRRAWCACLAVTISYAAGDGELIGAKRAYAQLRQSRRSILGAMSNWLDGAERELESELGTKPELVRPRKRKTRKR